MVITVPLELINRENDLINELNSLELKPAPSFIGNFKFKMIKNRKLLPYETYRQFNILNSLVPDQVFNTWFIQKYELGQNVLPHRDPKNNKGMTVVGLYSNSYFNTILKVGDKNYRQTKDTAWIFPTTINNKQGPIHSVEWDLDNSSPNAVRWALICNTIEYK